VRFAAILDGTLGTAAQQARALTGFLRDGAAGEMAGETVIFYRDDGDKERLVELAPTPAIRLIKTPARRPDLLLALLAAVARDGEISLFLFPASPASAEVAVRLACRSHGAALTDVLSIEAAPERLFCRKNVYSNHLVGRFELLGRPWCVTIDAVWDDSPSPPSPPKLEHLIVSDTDEAGEVGEAPFEDVELVDQPSSDDLADGRFVIVAGRGAGTREGVQRIAEAARKMGAVLGVTRPVAMNAWAPMDRIVGVSGTRTAPDLCLVAGASGAAAFYWGIEKAAFIVAIDLDEQAAIIKNADMAIIADGIAIVEELAEIIVAKRESD
jgi:electron transfer flavoprotein alpha subunit